MIKLKFFILALLIVTVYLTRVCAQEKNAYLFNFCPNDSVIDNIENDNYNEKLRIDSLSIVNSKMDTLLYVITKELSKKSICQFFYVSLTKQESNIYIEITADFSNEMLFRKEQKEYEHKYLTINRKDYIYGYLRLNNKVVYVQKYYIPNHIEDNDINNFFVKTGESNRIEKDKGSGTYCKNFENPMWLYQFKNNSMVLLKSVNAKYYY